MIRNGSPIGVGDDNHLSLIFSMLFLIRFLCMIGLALSAYGLYVKLQVDKNKDYKAACDLSDRVSCTKAFKSGHGTLFLLPNSVWGMIYYFLLFFLTYLSSGLVLLASFFSVIGSVYLAYILYTKVRSICLVCTSIYAINLLLFILSIMWVL
jgi:vitamin-K-epoxide reductase (warfarin-sensitive)